MLKISLNYFNCGEYLKVGWKAVANIGQ